MEKLSQAQLFFYQMTLCFLPEAAALGALLCQNSGLIEMNEEASSFLDSKQPILQQLVTKEVLKYAVCLARFRDFSLKPHLILS